jgi:hypothetical protein
MTSYAVTCPQHGRLAYALFHPDEARLIADAHDITRHHATPTATVTAEDPR